MFSMIWKSVLKSKASHIKFTESSHRLSEDVQRLYTELKISFEEITRELDGNIDPVQSINICKKCICFYEICEELLQHIMNECFSDTFLESIGRKRDVFEISNKIFKILMLFDLLKSRNPRIFSNYCELRLKQEDAFKEAVEDLQDDKISMLNMMSVPMGRLFLSMFSSHKFNLTNLMFLGKISKIHLDTEKQNRLCIFTYLCEINQWKYAFIFFSALFNRITDTNYFDLKNNTLKNLRGYLEMLREQK